MDDDALSRIIQGLTAGIGFVGAGAILKIDAPARIYGLTTAAGIWATAAIGVVVGLGRESTAVVATLMAFVVLWFFGVESPSPPSENAEKVEEASPQDPSGPAKSVSKSSPQRPRGKKR